jgi:hypothetical protein
MATTPSSKTIDFSKLKGLADFEFPDADFFKKPDIKKKDITAFKTPEREKAYEAYVRWAASPTALREPKTDKDFERLWKLPTDTVYMSFKKRPDFYERKMKCFWDWVFDRFPDVIHAVYRRAVQNSTADAKIFAELVAKRMEVQAPKPQMPPFMLIGVPQDKINALFVPEGYNESVDGEVVDGNN